MPKRRASTESAPDLDVEAPTDSESPQTPPTATRRAHKRVKTTIDDTVHSSAKRPASPLDTSPQKRRRTRAKTPEPAVEHVKREAEEQEPTPRTTKRAKRAEEPTVLSDVRRDLRAKQWLIHDLRQAFEGDERVLIFIDERAAHYATPSNVPDESPALTNVPAPISSTATEAASIADPVEPDPISQACQRGNEALAAGHHEDALSAFRSALDVDSSCLDALAGSALAHQQLGSFTQSLQAIASIEPLHSLPAQLHHIKARCLHETGHFAKALLSYDAAFVIDASLADLAIQREACRILSDMLKAASEAYQKKDLATLQDKISKMKEEIAQPPALWQLWIIEVCLDELPAQLFHAYTAALLAHRTEPDNAEVHHWYGRLTLADGMIDQAATYFRRALELDPNHVDARHYLDIRPKVVAADKALREADYRRAIKLYTSAIDLSPKDPTLFVHRAVAKQMTGDFVGAVADCEEVLAFNPGFYRALRTRARNEAQLGRVEDDAGNREAAQTFFDKALASFEAALMAFDKSDDALEGGSWAQQVREEVADVKKHLTARRKKRDAPDSPSTSRRTRSSQTQATPEAKSRPPPSSSAKSKGKTPKRAPTPFSETSEIDEDDEFFDNARNFFGSSWQDFRERARRQGWRYESYNSQGAGRAAEGDGPPLDFYAVLGVDRKAELKQIKRAYRAASLLAHPDKGGDHEKMALINEAYEVLSDATKRGEHDARCRQFGV